MTDQQKRKIRFSVIEEFEYEAEEFSDEEKSMLWYTMEEMVGLAKYEMQLAEEDNRKEGCTWRGLEHMKTGEDERQERVAAVLDAILDAYDEICEDDSAKQAEKEEKLRNECRALTRDDRKRAYKHGLRDAAVAEKIQEASSRDKPSIKKSASGKSLRRNGTNDTNASSKQQRQKRVRNSTSKDTTNGSKPQVLRSSSASTATSPPLRMNPIAA